MSEDDDDASKTEEPSHKKIEDARKKGNSASTRELNHFFMLGAIIFFLMNMVPSMVHGSIDLLSPFITRPESFEMGAADISQILRDVTVGAAKLLALTLLLTWGAAIAPSLLQGKWVFAAEQIKPKFSKLSPLAGIKRLLGKKAFIEFGKNLTKVAIVGVSSVIIALPFLHHLPALINTDIEFSLTFVSIIVRRMLLATVMFLFVISIIDYLYQRFSLFKSLRMTKQEVKEEYKSQEGDPHYKQKLKQIRTERARKRMMANVPKASVIITNPTHYAVALQYDPDTMAVPKVIAKGIDEVAARIREVAQEHKITLVRNPPLARLLYDTAEIDDDIPAAQYQAVAKIIGYVYRLKGKKPQAKSGPGYGKPKVRK